MPLTAPPLDSRKYQDLVNEAVARISVHTPEWTNYNQSDPGIAIVGVLAFLTESLLYRCNQIPDRNRIKFLQLLGMGLSPAAPAQGIVCFTNKSGPPVSLPLPEDTEVDAGKVPFRTEEGLNVLPIETRVYFKQQYTPSNDVLRQYNQLYSSLLTPTANNSQPATLSFYELQSLGPGGASNVDLSTTVDGSVWVGIFARTVDAGQIDAIRTEIAGQTISLGMVPGLVAGSNATVDLTPNPIGASDLSSVLSFYMPAFSQGEPVSPAPSYRQMDASPDGDPLSQPGIIEMVLPPADQLYTWTDLQPLEAGTNQYPPALDDTTLAARLITWIRVSLASPTDVNILWMGANAALVTQLTHVIGEVLPSGTGAPSQVVTLARASVIDGSVQLTVTPTTGTAETWTEIDDLMAAGPEVPVVSSSLPPGTSTPTNLPVHVFLLDPEARTLTFGDGTNGGRPPYNAAMSADYDYCVGATGNVGAGSISTGPALPSGVTVTNPVNTWGGADAETPDEGVKQITRYLQNRDRLVTAADFEAVALRTPGVSIGRVEVLSAFDPSLAPNAPGDAPGVVTLMVIPAYDPVNPNNPVPSQTFLNAIATWLDPRRLVTTEVILSGPDYFDVWVSVSLSVVPGQSLTDVIAAAKAAVVQFLSPLPAPGTSPLPDTVPVYQATSPSMLQVNDGWPLGKAVQAAELSAVVSRVSGVLLVNSVALAGDDGNSVSSITMTGLMLPRLAGLSVGTGDVSIASLQGQRLPSSSTGTVVPVPVVPENC
jgi:hypothetical protein